MTDSKEQNIGPSVYGIAKYFDDVLDGYVMINLTLDQAEESIKRFNNGVYISYEIKKIKSE